MIIENLNELEHELVRLGFGAVLFTSALQERILEAGEGDLALSLTEDFDGLTYMDSVLHFKWLQKLGLLQFQSFTSRLYAKGNPSAARVQSFRVSPNGITLREAFNLLSGRSVNKETGLLDEENCNVWVRLDFDRQLPDGNYKMIEYSSIYGYDIERLLQQLPIEELQSDALRQNLILSLRKGNQHPVTFILPRKKAKKFIEACPERKCIVIRSMPVEKPPKRDRVPAGGGLAS